MVKCHGNSESISEKRSDIPDSTTWTPTQRFKLWIGVAFVCPNQSLTWPCVAAVLSILNVVDRQEHITERYQVWELPGTYKISTARFVNECVFKHHFCPLQKASVRSRTRLFIFVPAIKVRHAVHDLLHPIDPLPSHRSFAFLQESIVHVSNLRDSQR